MLSLFAVLGALHLNAPPANDAWPANQKIVCNPSPSGTAVIDPPELRSSRGFLAVTLHLTGDSNPQDLTGLCWAYRFPTPHGPVTLTNPPTLHLRQGDKLILTLVNELLRPPSSGAQPLGISGASMKMAQVNDAHVQGPGLMCGQPQLSPTPTPNPRTHRIYDYHRTPWNETNMHFHGLNTSPLAPGDDVVNILLCPRKSINESPNVYTYVVNIPRDEPPGTYWYHPHAHGESEHQVLSQLTGAIIVDTRTKSIPDTMKSRMIIVRDLGAAGSMRPMIAPGADAVRARDPGLDDLRLGLAQGSLVQPAYYHRPGGWPFGKPLSCPSQNPVFNTKELVINGIPLPPKPNSFVGLPSTTVAYGQTQYWRLANTSADTILDIEMLVNGKLTPIQVTSRDAVPLVMQNGQPTWQPVPMSHVQLGPAGRVEFYFIASVPNAKVVFRTRKIDAGCQGDVALERDLMIVHVTNARQAVAPPFVRVMPHSVDPVRTRFSDLFAQKPARQRTFVFTEYNRSDEKEPDLYITELSNPDAIEHPYDMSGPPDVIAKNGTVEDWTVLNYTQESHVFHIHQIHFLVLQGDGIENGQGLLLDTVVVPYGTFPHGGVSGNKMRPGAVRLRMDFRAPDIVGTFVYHCHILSHEDNGMMAKIEIVK